MAANTFQIKKILGWYYLVDVEDGAVSRWPSLMQAKQEYLTVTGEEWIDDNSN